MKLKSYIYKITSAVLATLLALLTPMVTFAGSLEDITAELSTLKAATAANQTIQFQTPSGVSTSTDTIIITFADFTIPAPFGTTSVDIAAGDSGTCSSASYTDRTIADDGTAAAGEWGFATTTTSITLTPPTDVTEATGATSTYCIQVQIGTNATHGGAGTAQITNAAAGDRTIAFTGGFGDTGTSTVKILTDDQVQLSAEVPQSITFSISETSASFGDLNTSATRYATSTGDKTSESVAHVILAGTNATGGYTLTVAGNTLESGGDSITAIGSSDTALNTGSVEQFGMKAEYVDGTGITIDPTYIGSVGYGYDGDSGASTVATASGLTDTTTYSITYVANIASDTEAGTYTTALTYVATANY